MVQDPPDKSAGAVQQPICANKSLIHVLAETGPGFCTAKEPWLTLRSLAPMRRIGQSDSVMRLPTGRSGTELLICQMEGAAVGPIPGGGGRSERQVIGGGRLVGIATAGESLRPTWEASPAQTAAPCPPEKRCSYCLRRMRQASVAPSLKSGAGVADQGVGFSLRSTHVPNLSFSHREVRSRADF
jgi:hypothetical protein